MSIKRSLGIIANVIGLMQAQGYKMPSGEPTARQRPVYDERLNRAIDKASRRHSGLSAKLVKRMAIKKRNRKAYRQMVKNSRK